MGSPGEREMEAQRTEQFCRKPGRAVRGSPCKPQATAELTRDSGLLQDVGATVTQKAPLAEHEQKAHLPVSGAWNGGVSEPLALLHLLPSQ